MEADTLLALSMILTGLTLFFLAVGDIAPCPELPFRIDVKALGGTGREAFSNGFIGVCRFSCNEEEGNQ